ncbi:Rieske 2Fe-2S domain-containing protein [Paracoccus sp. Z330]|uniref:Rieske 2Fe-2S domain-containing protein n=1 Tax=Paracoccus onchidii TaxID=3017813 RepID=A0ABT4ZBJ7_9RHOB|nr:Rieske 2Fe-2S domain-containing protein [Paracoccus onchidii]MDB6176010.1 Rieske 2Fe-2S domain-containing protein [Paracoccus onchidii]
MSWTDYAAAPAPGTRICDAAGITTPIAMEVTTGKGKFPLLVMRVGLGFRAYVNACPHQFLPLNYRAERIMSADGTKLLCTAHGARFDMATGAVVDGADCGLEPVPLELIDGFLHIAPPPAG